MATPPTRVSYSVPASGNYTTTTSPKTSASFNVVAGDLIIVQAGAENSATVASVTPSASGGSVTWSLVAQYPASNNGATSTTKVWVGTVGATANGITVSLARISGTNDYWGFSATVVRGHGGVGAAFQGGITGSSGAPSVTGTVSANSMVFCVVNDWDVVDGSSRAWRSVNGSPITETLYIRSPAHHTGYGGYVPDTGAGGSITLGLTTPSNQRWSLSGVEILGVASSLSESVDPAGLTLQGVQPTLSGSGAVSSTPGNAGITLQGIQPSLSGSGAVSVAVDTAILSLTGVDAAAASGGFMVAVDPATLTLSGVQPTASASGVASRSVDPASLALVGNMGASLGGNGAIAGAVDTAILQLSSIQPSLAGGGVASRAIDKAILALQGVNPNLSAGVVIPILVGDKRVQAVFIGDREVIHRYLGDVQLW